MMESATICFEADLINLDDPKNTYGETEKIHHATRHGFVNAFAEVDRWLEN